MNEIIDVSRLGDLEKYTVTTVFQPRWDNVLLMTAYDRERTYVLTVNGEELVLEKRLKEVLRNFSEYAGVHQLEMQTLYSLVKGRTRGIIAGHYELVPSCGKGNCQVVYYMAHQIDNLQCHHDQGVLITFKGTNRQLITARIDTCISTFRRLLDQAHRVGLIQLESVKNLCNSFGISDDELAHFACKATDHEQALHRQQFEQVFMNQIFKVVQNTANKCYGEDLTAEFYAQLRRILEKY